MGNIGSWRFWVIVMLALTTLACAGRAERRERREAAREERRERMEQRRAERQAALERRRAEREHRQETAREPDSEPAPQAQPEQRQTAAASFAPVSAPVSAAAADASSKLVFMRVSKQTSGIDAALFDVTEPGAPKYIGTVNSASKLAYPVNPGLYTFMALGDTAEFMQATIVAGKTYYALVIPRSGAKRFTIEPVRQNEIGTKEFIGWDRGTRPTGSAQQPYNAADAAEKRQRYWQEWIRKSESQRAELTLNAEDGK